VLQGREDGRGREKWEKTSWNLRSRECSQPRENYQTREKNGRKILLYGELHVKGYQDGLRAHCKKRDQPNNKH